MHPLAPWTDVTFYGCYWNDPDRVRALLQYVRPWFKHVIVSVQTDDPDGDPTLDAAAAVADYVYLDTVKGLAEPTMNRDIGKLPTPWAFVVSADEWPTPELLDSFQDLITQAEPGIDGYWIRFLSSIEGVPYPSESDNHLRLFRTRFGWPASMHSRPEGGNFVFLPPERGLIHHDRSLDEMMRDYLRYFSMGQGNMSWTAHNRVMMHDACEATAARKGWEFVRSFPWWPDVRAIAFPDEAR